MSDTQIDKLLTDTEPSPGEACVTFAVKLLVILLLGGLLFEAGWNLGIVGLVAAAGGSVTKIGYWTAAFTVLLVRVVGGVFKP